MEEGHGSSRLECPGVVHRTRGEGSGDALRGWAPVLLHENGFHREAGETKATQLGSHDVSH